MFKNKERSRLKIIPLGGLDEIGMNITAFEYEDSIIVVDCGLSFPDDDMLGIDLVIPDVSYLEKNADRLKGFVFTHGHEDHIGALPYILNRIRAPLYATRLTMGLIENKLEESELTGAVALHVVQYGENAKISLGKFEVEFIKTNHSIVDAAALAIYSPAGVVIHTGDFKVDYTPVHGDAIDLQRFARIGHEGVLAMLCDSTNAERSGFTQSEKTVGKTLNGLFADNENKRIVVATFASNVDRVQQIIDTAYRHNRKVAVEGRSMVNTIETAQKLGCIDIPEHTLVSIDELKNFPDERTVIITTGSQGESMAALSRMASHTHKKIIIGPKDTVIFSSTPIPGNEKAVTKVINDLLYTGADVIFQDTHVSGHACQEEIKLLYTLVNPQYVIPVHGEYKHLVAHKKLAMELGIPEKNIFIMHSGDVLELCDKSARISGKVQTGDVLVDGLGVGDVGNVVLRDRQHLSENGIMIVSLALDGEGQLASGPMIVTRGFIYVRESDELVKQMTDLVYETVSDLVSIDVRDFGKIKSRIKEELGDFIWKKTNRRPMILPIILEV